MNEKIIVSGLRICRDCKWSEEPTEAQRMLWRDESKNIALFWRCKHEAGKSEHLVTGEISWRSCWGMRECRPGLQSLTDCGPEGKLWEPKE